MTDTTHEAPERIWAWGWRACSSWQQQTWQHEDEPMSTMEYVRADLVQAAVAAALREMFEQTWTAIGSLHGKATAVDALKAIVPISRALITPDAQAALDRVVAARLGRIRIAVVELSLAGDLPAQAVEKILAAIREGGE